MTEETEGTETEVTETEAPKEEAAPSIDDMLETAWDEQEENSEEKSSEEEKSDTEKESDDVAAAADDEKSGAEPLSAPEHWSAEDKELFVNSTEEVQQWIVGRDKDLQADYTTKTQELADQRKNDEPLYDLAEQTKAHFATQGVTAAQGMAQLVQAQQALMSGTPEQRRVALEQIGASYGISLTPGIQNEEDEYQDPELGKLTQRQNALEQYLVQQQQTATTQQRQSDLQLVQSFAAEQTDKGDLKHPHFDAVRQHMAVLLPQAGTIEEAYNQAVYANPETRKSLLEGQAKEASALQEKERAERVTIAKKAAPSNTRSTSIAGKTVKTSVTVKDAAEDAWDELASA